jgi:hypothetical protein
MEHIGFLGIAWGMPNATRAFAALPNSPSAKALRKSKTYPDTAYGAATIAVDVDMSTARRLIVAPDAGGLGCLKKLSSVLFGTVLA